jgi:HEPN domain-containing protein
MKEETRKLLEKAARAIEAAKTLLKTGSADFAAGNLINQ